MFSLSYTSAYDPYHTVFRYLVLLNAATDGALSYRTARIADFFLCFPWVLRNVRAPRTVENFAKSRNALVNQYTPSTYERISNERIVFERMEVIHAAAVSALAGADMIDASELENSWVKLLPNAVGTSLREPLLAYTEKNANLVEFLATKLPQIDGLGQNGLFARTGLGDYSYDIA